MDKRNMSDNDLAVAVLSKLKEKITDIKQIKNVDREYRCDLDSVKVAVGNGHYKFVSLDGVVLDKCEKEIVSSLEQYLRSVIDDQIELDKKEAKAKIAAKLNL